MTYNISGIRVRGGRKALVPRGVQFSRASLLLFVFVFFSFLSSSRFDCSEGRMEDLQLRTSETSFPPFSFSFFLVVCFSISIRFVCKSVPEITW